MLIQARAIEGELQRRGLEVTDEDLTAARATLVPEPADGGQTMTSQLGPLSDATAEVVAAGIVGHLVLDRALRQSNPEDPAQQADVLARAPSVAERYCGPFLTAPLEQKQAILDQIAAGTPIESIDDKGVPVLFDTKGPGQHCLLVAESPDQLVDLFDRLQPGEVGIGPGVSKDGQQIIYVTQFESREATTGAEATRAAQLTLASMRANGYSTYQRLLYLDLNPDIDPEWGRWEPQVGLLPPDVALPFTTQTAIPTTTSTSTTAPPTTTTLPPPPPPPANPLDPGTGDLVAGARPPSKPASPWRGEMLCRCRSVPSADPRHCRTLTDACAWACPPVRTVGQAGCHREPRVRPPHRVPIRHPGPARRRPRRMAGVRLEPGRTVGRLRRPQLHGVPPASHGMSACQGPSLSWAAGFVQAGPAAAPLHRVTSFGAEATRVSHGAGHRRS